MTDTFNRVEPHGCIVCGRIHQLLVIYAPAGGMISFTVISPGAQVVADATRPLAACSTHGREEIERAMRLQPPGIELEDEEE